MQPADSSPPLYAGEFRHAIDEKNRITIPSRWRRDAAEEFILLPDATEKFLQVMSPDQLRAMSQTPEVLSISAPQRRVFLRHLHARAQHAVADKQGRLVLPDDLCKKLQLRGEVALVGGVGRFEIWNLTRWKRAHEEETATYQSVANLVGL